MMNNKTNLKLVAEITWDNDYDQHFSYSRCDNGDELFDEFFTQVKNTNQNLYPHPTVMVHNGVFHADDVLCAAFISAFIGGYTLTRSRDAEDANSADFILDVGRDMGLVDGYYRRSDGKLCLVLDHHDKDRATYVNGVQFAACGKLFDVFHANRNTIPETLLWPIEASDNGQMIEGIHSSLLSWVPLFNPDWDSEADANSRFNAAVEIAVKILIRVTEQDSSIERADEKIEDHLLNSLVNGNILVLDEYIPWQPSVIEDNEAGYSIDYVVYPMKSGGWGCQAVPKEKGSFETRKPFPESWRGIRGTGLEMASGVKGGRFAHPSGFLTGWETQEAAVEAAMASTEAWEESH